MTRIRAVVQRIVPEATDIRSFVFRRADGEPFPDVTPGAHVDVHPPGGPARPYSICRATPDMREITIAVKREPRSRGGSQAMHDALSEGQEIDLSAPRNSFALDAGAGPALLFAGGIGITPILAMATRLASLGRPFHLHYFGRSRAEMAFCVELEAPPLAGAVTLHIGLVPEAVAPRLRALLAGVAPETRLYLCGPSPFMDAVTAEAGRLLPAAAIVSERFQAEVAVPAGGDRPFTVHLARRGLNVPVGADQSIVAALAAAGVAVECSCEQGICGTCVTGLLEGEADHRDMYLSDAEIRRGDRIALCVSRALGERLVLDL